MERNDQIDQWIALAKQGEISWTEVAERLLVLEHPAANADQPDADRARRCGFGEVIFGENKSAETIVAIGKRLIHSGQRELLVTRCDHQKLSHIVANFRSSRYDALARTLRLSEYPIDSPINLASDRQGSGHPTSVYSVDANANEADIMVVTAGSTDLSVAREALETLRWMGVRSSLLTDVGVAGPYRLLPHLNRLRAAKAIVVCAGMEGALASVMGGLVACPVIAVPTSVGYGANLQGITTLLSMISSCAAGVTVVNIDAGFKGGYVAGLIATRRS